MRDMRTGCSKEAGMLLPDWRGIVLAVVALLMLEISAATAEECGCNVCHGNPPVLDNAYGGPNGLVIGPLTGATSAGAHARHVSSATGAAQNERCYVCHVGGMPYSPMCGNYRIQIGFGVSGSGITYDGRTLSAPYSYEATSGTVVTSGGTQKCSNLYCHSNGTGGTKNLGSSGPPPLYDPRPVVPNASPSWTSSGPPGCSLCHGYPPSYETNSSKSNSHLRPEHQQSCNFCHYATTTDGVTITNPANHANGFYDVQPDPSAIYPGTYYTNPVNFTYAYDPGGGRCSSVSCHPGGSGHTWGRFIELVVGLYPKAGPDCNEVIFDHIQFGTPTDPPYTYFWNFGDGTTGEGFPISHIYSAPGSYPVILTGRDKDYHPFSTAVTVTAQATNAPPVLSKTLTLKRYTLTVTDASFDPDCSACGHSGNGKIEILWDGSGSSTKDTSVDLCSPTNKVYTHVYPSAAANYPFRYLVTDNAGATASSQDTVSVPGPITLSGRITHAGSGAPYPNVSVYLYAAGGSSALVTAKTDANGLYTLTRTWTGDCYDVKPIAGAVVFTPAKQTACDISSDVNFTAP